MGIDIYQVDAFTAAPFKGNSAAVCLLTEERDAAWMQDLAMEMNLSETAFLRRREDGFGLRWFTPAIEVELCGHATLASAHALWDHGHLAPGETARFHSASGLLTATQRAGLIELDFPRTAATRIQTPAALSEALGVRPVEVGMSQFDYLVELESETAVRELQPDFRKLGALPARGIMITSPADSADFDFVSRFFAPAAGIDEDPVTGSAHCCLGPYWSLRLNKKELVAYQASSRGGVVHVRVGEERVYLGGQAVTVLRGQLVNV